MNDFSLEDFAERRIDQNLYFCPATTSDDWPDLALLKSKNVDRRSLFADPLFADWKNGNFTLSTKSPAIKLGIEQIDIRPAGLTDKFPSEWR